MFCFDIAQDLEKARLFRFAIATAALAAPERVYTMRHMLLLEVSTPQGYELHLEVSTLQRYVLHREVSIPQGA